MPDLTICLRRIHDKTVRLPVGGRKKEAAHKLIAVCRRSNGVRTIPFKRDKRLRQSCGRRKTRDGSFFGVSIVAEYKRKSTAKLDRRFFHNSYQLSDRTFVFRVLRRVTTISRRGVRDTSISVATDPFRFAVIIRRPALILVSGVGGGYPTPGTSCRPTYGYGSRPTEWPWQVRWF